MNRKQRRIVAKKKGKGSVFAASRDATVRLSVDQKSADAGAHNDLANALQAQGKLDEAMIHYRQALTLNPEFPEAHNNLGSALQRQGKLDDAVVHYREGLTIKPDYAEAHCNLGIALKAQGKLDEAAVHFRRALTLKPDYAEAHNSLGNALRDQGNLDEAVIHYRQALTIKPDYAKAHSNLGITLKAQGKLDDAAVHFRRALTLKPDYAEVHNNLGNALREQGNLDEAVIYFRRALTIRPDYAEAYSGLGNALKSQGKLEEARRAHETATKHAPKNAVLYQQLAESKRFSTDDPDLAAMEKLAREMALLPLKDQTALHFALGKAYEDLGRYEQSFFHLIEGNALKRQQIVYDEASTFALFDRISAVFTPELMIRQRGLGLHHSAPVFIFGMPRSGSTLVEQILASHPNVYGAGELTQFAMAVAQVSLPKGSVARYPEMVSSMSGDELCQLGESYVGAIRRLAPTAERITDKMLRNFQFAGLIHLILPNARMIHTRRDPLDTCLSCFAKLFTGDQPYSYDLGELGRYYRAYETVMEHWRNILPQGVMLEVQYEDITSDLDGQARRIVAHCGLEWDDACLTFHKTPRPVHTASAAQVRQPIYRTSVGRWRPYGKLLAPLFEALGIDQAHLARASSGCFEA